MNSSKKEVYLHLSACLMTFNVYQYTIGKPISTTRLLVSIGKLTTK